jgi:uncharacterized protein involved in cysteine biosynthesis
MLASPPIRALAQLDDPAFLGVVLRSVAWAALAFVGLAALLSWAGHAAIDAWRGQHAGAEWLGWLADLAGPVGAALSALLLFLPLAALIGTLFIDRVARAVERRWYPSLAPAVPAPLSHQLWDGLALGLRVLVLQVVALLLSFLLPGAGWLLGWLIAAWAIGRGLFMAAAMRRMGRPDALRLCRARMAAVLVQGGWITALALLPGLNLLAPVLGTAAMVHVLHAPDMNGPG